MAIFPPHNIVPLTCGNFLSGGREHREMRKYRYGDPAQTGIFRKYGKLIYFIATWNLLGFVIWKVMNVEKRKDDENWDSKTTTQKYLNIIGMNEEKAKHIKIHGLTNVEVNSPSDKAKESEVSAN